MKIEKETLVDPIFRMCSQDWLGMGSQKAANECIASTIRVNYLCRIQLINCMQGYLTIHCNDCRLAALSNDHGALAGLPTLYIHWHQGQASCNEFDICSLPADGFSVGQRFSFVSKQEVAIG